MVSEREQERRVFNPLEFWQNYFINWIQASSGFYENAIKANEYWFKVFWEPWLASGVAEQKKRLDK
jgi:hypothetical protein